ncbi:polyprenyl synthetase family protein [Neobacillus sp. SM06]|uniref:polyprenyl synthetase family protein n=1 Tax=Neobacillus sp. SM06 TaxID=3422492 RepID=UPI003D282BE0
MFNVFAKTYKQLLEDELQTLIARLDAPPVIKEAMFYSLSAGGKRIRPLLLFATMEAFGTDPKRGLMAAAAIEMIHTYSLIHDDLPSMDNDDLRRGKPTNHKVFGDAIATLAGDALLTYSFEVMGNIPEEYTSPETKIKLIVEMAKAAGTEGMVGGQVADMYGEGKKITIEELEYIHIHKTGKILSFCVTAGALLSRAVPKQLNNLALFAHHLGLAFQIQDDILDIEGNEELIGKPVGSDRDNQKSTYPLLLSMAGAKNALAEHIQMAKYYLANTNLKTTMLNEITDLVATRDH